MSLKKNEMVQMIVGKKCWFVSRKMALTTIQLAMAHNYNKIALLAVEKNGIITLTKEIFSDVKALENEKLKWKKSGYKCYTTTNGGN